MEIGCLLAAYLQTLFVAVVLPGKYCQAETAAGSDEFCSSSQQLGSHGISEITVHKVTRKGEEHPAPQGVKGGSCSPVHSDAYALVPDHFFTEKFPHQLRF